MCLSLCSDQWCEMWIDSWTNTNSKLRFLGCLNKACVPLKTLIVRDWFNVTRTKTIDVIHRHILSMLMQWNNLGTLLLVLNQWHFRNKKCLYDLSVFIQRKDLPFHWNIQALKFSIRRSTVAGKKKEPKDTHTQKNRRLANRDELRQFICLKAILLYWHPVNSC